MLPTSFVLSVFITLRRFKFDGCDSAFDDGFFRCPTAGIVAGAGVLAVALAWAIVAVHAVKIARANPIRALRYE